MKQQIRALVEDWFRIFRILEFNETTIEFNETKFELQLKCSDL